MSRILAAAIATALLLCLAACESTPPQPVVVVGKDDFMVAGQRVKTLDEMRAVMSEKKISSVTLRTEPDVPYERVGNVIYSIFRMGANVDKLDVPPAR